MTDALETPSHKLARDYMRLGGRRQVKIDDNQISVRQWEDDPPEAERFWKEKIEPLAEDERRQVAEFLPSITEDETR